MSAFAAQGTAGPPTSADSARSAHESVDRPAASTRPARTIEVPVVVEYSQKQAQRRLERRGLTVDITHEPAGCRPIGEVIAQRPRAGRLVPTGSPVRIVVASPATGSPACVHGKASSHDRDVAALFARFSQDPAGREAPFAPAVRLRLGTVAQRVLRGAEVHDPRAWEFSRAYAGYRGPFSALDLLEKVHGDYRLSVGPHPVCAGPVPDAPRRDRHLRQLSIQPRSPDGCLSWWIVDLFLNDVGQISTVSLTVWEP